MRIALVAARFNADVTDAMVEAARDRIDELGLDHAGTTRVPGVYDAPLATQRALERDDVDAVVVIGAVVTGETDHDQILMHSTSKTLQELSLDHDKPVTLAVTGPGMTQEQAEARIAYAAQGVDAAAQIHAALGEGKLDLEIQPGGH